MDKKISASALVAVFGFLMLPLTMSAPADGTPDIYDNSIPDCPRIVTRSEWKARKARSSHPLDLSPTPYVVVHHGGITRYCHDKKTCSEIVRSYQNLHMDERGWEDLGYSFVIGEDGNVYEGRGWDLIGAHAPGYNTQSIGVCVIGDFTERLPNEAALKALRSLMSCGVALGKIMPDYRVIGHRQTRSTECPGETLYQYVRSLPNWTSNPKPYRSNATISALQQH